MAKATEVFTPTDVPTITYVERTNQNYEKLLRHAFAIPKMIVSISGPSKSGKTVLVNKVAGSDNLIHLYGASIKAPEDLWKNVVTWMGINMSYWTEGELNQIAYKGFKELNVELAQPLLRAL